VTYGLNAYVTVVFDVCTTNCFDGRQRRLLYVFVFVFVLSV